MRFQSKLLSKVAVILYHRLYNTKNYQNKRIYEVATYKNYLKMSNSDGEDLAEIIREAKKECRIDFTP